MEEKESSTIESIKSWLFPVAVTLIGIFAGTMLNDIKSDLAEVKSDIKVLMAQSNIDKTRIDNLERQVYKGNTTSYPLAPIKEEDPKANQYAVLADNKIKYIK
jgi:hypothetical protein